MSNSYFSSANPPKIGDRVKIDASGVNKSNTGSVVDLISKGETYAKIMLESGGVAQAVSVVLLTPAPTIREQMPRYRHEDVQKHLAAVVMDKFRETAMTQAEIAQRAGVSGATIGAWRRKAVPGDRLQMIADVLGVVPLDVEIALHESGIRPTHQVAATTAFVGAQ